MSSVIVHSGVDFNTFAIGIGHRQPYARIKLNPARVDIIPLSGTLDLASVFLDTGGSVAVGFGRLKIIR